MIVAGLLILLSSEVAASLHPTVNPLQNNSRICGKVRSFAGATGSIHSPGYPYRYPSNTYCSYDITVNVGFRIELTWKDFDIDGDMPHCNSKNGDYVEAFTGCGERRRFLARFCSRNSVMPHALYSVDNCMSLHLFARPEEFAKTSKGFVAEYRAFNMSKVLPYQKCNVTLAESSGVIHSTFWPWTYQHDKLDNCHWHLKVDQAMVVQFTFMDVRTFNEYGHHDAVVIQGIGSLYVSQQSWKEFYGWHFPFLYKTRYNELVINWRINSVPFYRGSLGGFIAGYVAYRPVDRDMAGWQYALIGCAAFMAVYISITFSCRHSLKQQSAKRRHYRRLVSSSSTREDMQVADGQAGNGQVDESDVQRVEQDAEDNADQHQPPAGNDIQVNHTRNASDISNTDPSEPSAMRMRSFINNGNDTRYHDVLPPSNFRVEAIFHPVPPSVRLQSTFENHKVQDTSLSDTDEQLLHHQPDTLYPTSATLPSTSAFPSSAPTALAPPTSAPSIHTCSMSLPQTSTNESGGLQPESDLPIPATDFDGVSSQSGPTINLGFVDDDIPEIDSTLNKPETTLFSDSGVASEAIAPYAPPHYEEIYDELRSLSQIVADIISDME